MDKSNNVRYFFSGSSLGLMEDIFLSEKSPLYLMAGKINMAPLSEDEVKKFIINRFKSVGFRISREYEGLFFQYTRGIPFYIQKLGLLCYQNALINNEKVINNKIILDSYNDMIDEFDGEFESRLTNRFSDKQIQVIRAIAQLDKPSLSEIAGFLNIQSSDISSTIKRLVQSMILNKTEDNKYFITDELFKNWILRN